MRAWRIKSTMEALAMSQAEAIEWLEKEGLL